MASTWFTILEPKSKIKYTKHIAIESENIIYQTIHAILTPDQYREIILIKKLMFIFYSTKIGRSVFLKNIMTNCTRNTASQISVDTRKIR